MVEFNTIRFILLHKYYFYDFVDNYCQNLNLV